MANKKLAYGLGAIVQEGFQFGVLDGIREGFRSGMSGEEYHLLEPALGIGMGGAFGALKWLSPAGKSSSFKVDFLSGLRGTIAKGSDILKKDSYPVLRYKAQILGADARAIGEEVVKDVSMGGKKFSFDLTSVEYESFCI
jgi:hypothetical protein